MSTFGQYGFKGFVDYLPSRQVPLVCGHQRQQFSIVLLVCIYTLNSVIPSSIMSHTISYLKILGNDVRSTNLTPYCHISFPCITKVVINANHQRSPPTPSHCDMCQHVKGLLLLLRMSLVEY